MVPNDMIISTKFYKDVLEWDVKNWKYAIIHWEKYSFNYQGKRILCVGEKNGGLTLYYALKGASVVCTDLNGVTEEAKKKHAAYGLTSTIEYRQADILNLPFEDNQFEFVSFKSVMGALKTYDNQKAALHEIKRVLKNDGCLLFAENMTASKIHNFLRKKFVPWAEYWKYLDVNDMSGLFDIFSSTEFRYFGFLGTFGRNEFQRTLLAIFDGIFDFIIPDKYKYIVSGICRVEK